MPPRDNWLTDPAEGADPSWSQTRHVKEQLNLLKGTHFLPAWFSPSFAESSLSWEKLFSPAYLSSDLLTCLTQGASFKGTAVVFVLFCFMQGVSHVAPTYRTWDLSKWGERKREALSEVADPCTALFFIISVTAAVFNMFVCVLDHFLFHFFGACNFCFSPFFYFIFIFLDEPVWLNREVLIAKLFSCRCHFSLPSGYFSQFDLSAVRPPNPRAKQGSSPQLDAKSLTMFSWSAKNKQKKKIQLS